MRPNQQNNKNRSRGRSNNNNNGGRKHLNPLSRNYESNGPDVKVRGNAAHVAEKYLQLARDAQSSGDSVMAENYLQHAEHYFRLVSTAQQQMQPRSDQTSGQTDTDDDDDFPPIIDRFSSPEPPPSRFQPQQGQGGGEQQPQQAPAEGEAAAPETSGAVAEASAEGGEGQGDGDGDAPRRRERRGRRRSRGGQNEGADPAGSPQPEVGELPAFLTATTPAAE